MDLMEYMAIDDVCSVLFTVSFVMLGFGILLGVLIPFLVFAPRMVDKFLTKIFNKWDSKQNKDNE